MTKPKGDVSQRGSLEERFWRKVMKKQGCWEWTGATHEFGYGIIGRGGRRQGLIKAHRVSWTIHFGEIPDGLDVLHECDNPPCTNPEHLFLGTNADNQRDMDLKERRIAPPLKSGSENGWAKLDANKVRMIRELRKEGVWIRKIAQRFSVHPSTIKRVISGERWSHVR